ncbi:hypothetical protein PGO21_23510 [Klebsiella aerogenes]
MNQWKNVVVRGVILPLALLMSSSLKANELALVVADKAVFSNIYYTGKGTKQTFKSSTRYVVRGDKLITGMSPQGDLRLQDKVYATYIGSTGVTTTGWLNAKDIIVMQEEQLPDMEWKGTWQSSEGKCSLVLKENIATFQFLAGGSDPNMMSMTMHLTQQKRNPHAQATSFAGQGEPCTLILHSLGDYMIVSDPDMKCFMDNAQPEGIMRKRY